MSLEDRIAGLKVIQAQESERRTNDYRSSLQGAGIKFTESAGGVFQIRTESVSVDAFPSSERWRDNDKIRYHRGDGADLVSWIQAKSL